MSIEPTGRGDARYVITAKDGTPSVVNAELPGTLVDLIVKAAIPYTVKRVE